MNWFEITGNPFVDAGMYVLLDLNSAKLKKKSISELNNLPISSFQESAEILTKTLGQKAWVGSLTQIFPNSKIVNFAYKSQEVREAKYREFLNELVDNFQDSQQFDNSCWVCNKRKGSIYSDRSQFPLIGTIKVANFFPFWDDGIKICPNCLFSVQFIPLVQTKCVDKMVFLISDNNLIMRKWTEEQLKPFYAQQRKNEITGVNNPKYKNPINFLFYKTTKLIANYEEDWEHQIPYIRLYSYTNYLQHNASKGPAVLHYDIPSSVFKFFSKLKNAGLMKDWFEYVLKQTIRYGDKDKDLKNEEALKVRENPVFRRLMEEKSIVRNFIDKKNHTNKIKWDILRIYAQVVLKMKKDELEYVKFLGDFIVKIMKSTNNIKKLKDLERCTKYNQFTGIIRKIAKESLTIEKEPIVKVDDLALKFLPETDFGINWMEMRDFLLFRIYETGFQFLKQFQKEIEEEVKSELDEDDENSEKMEVEEI